MKEPAHEPTLAPLRERWPQILRYALHPTALSTIVAIAVSHVVVLWLPFGWLIDLVVWAAFFKYGFEVLRWSANGRDTAPEISFTVSDEIGRYAVLMFVLVELLLFWIGRVYGVIPTFVVGAVLMFAMPAVVTILALEEGIVRALNPLAWLMISARVGNPYLILVAFFFAALVLQSIAATTLHSPFVPEFVTDFIVDCLVNYFLVTNFHLIGSTIYEHRDALGYAGHLELSDETPYTDPSRTVLDAARARAATGDARGAATLLRDEIAAHPDQLPLHDEYRHWLRQEDDNPELVAHAKKYIPILIARQQERRAIDVARESQLADPAFAVDDAAHVTQLAHAAADAGQTQLALALVAGFHKRFRNHPDIGRNYLLAAKLWAERMNKEMQARALLNQIKVTMPNDPVIPQVDAYIAFLDKLAATAPQKPPA
jgi:hypothetical protein